jgi:MFS family permease
MSAAAKPEGTIRTTIPARIDRLRWSPFHTRMVAGLGVAWILDGLQITIASSVTGILATPAGLDMSSSQIGLIATVYLVGQVTGALFFGRLSDRLGRRRLFMWTLALYFLGSGAAAFTLGDGPLWLLFFYATRFVAGMGIGGEYAAINSAIDEMMPARYRGRVDVWINGTYWAGAIIGSFVSLILLNMLPPDEGWRVAFLVGPLFAIVIFFVRRTLPESPRWLITHGREAEAEESIALIEAVSRDAGMVLDEVDDSQAIVLKPEKPYGYRDLLRVVFKQYPRRGVLGASLMITQSFLYNAIFFTYAIVLTNFYDVDPTQVPIYGLAFSVGNLAGPLLLGRLFDTIGRRKMISGTYLISGALLAVSAFLFDAGVLTAATQTLMWVIIFFFASAGASAAYLTVSEIFPIEIRAQTIAVFFAIAQVFGAMGPLIYGALIGDGTDKTGLFIGYLFGAAVMIFGGLIAAWLGINAEGKSLESVARPLTAVSTEPAET